MNEIEQRVEMVSNALKGPYIETLRYRLCGSRILSAARETTNNVYGKEVIVLTEEGEAKKSLETIALSMKIHKDALRCCTTTDIMVALLNSEVSSLIDLGIEEQIKLLCREVRADLKTDATDDSILEAFFNIEIDHIREGLMICHLCDWMWLEDEQSGKVIRPAGDFYTATLVRYMTFVMSPELKKEIREKLK